MDCEIIIYFIALSQNIHLLGLFKDKHSKELNFPTLFYEQPWQFSEGFSYQQIAKWELFHKFRDFSTNISNLFLKLLKFI
jgi:hypothetical protein